MPRNMKIPPFIRTLLIAIFSIIETQAITVDHLRCENRENPLGIDVKRPRLSWILDSGRQTAYQVVVDGVWDSGKVASDRSINVEYDGKPLSSASRYEWKVRVWDGDGKPSEWSRPATWTTGLLKPEDWHGKWVRAPKFEQKNPVSPWLRKTFELDDVPKEALVFVASRGYHELWVNGRRAGESVLNPAVSVLKQRTFSVAYDIAPLLRPGRNTVGLWLGRGWHAPGIPGVSDERPQVRLQGLVKTGGKTMELVTDETWKSRVSPYATLGAWRWNKYGGESYDARLEDPKWCVPDDDERGWQSVEVIEAPSAVTQAQNAPLNRIGKVIPAASCTGSNGTWELDFGTDIAGWVRLRWPRLEPGQHLVIRYRDSGGRDYNQCDEFISAGRSGEEFVSKFNYHGFRTVLIEGLAGKPDLKDAEAMLIESDLPVTGSFECSNDLFNRMHRVNLWTLRCLNLGGYMVDCPHRERLGYGDGQVSAETCLMNFWMPNFYEKWMQDWVDTQDPSTGALPFSTPYHPPAGAGNFGREGPPGWGGAMPAIVWRTYLQYDDTRLLTNMVAPMQLFLSRVENHTTNGILRGYGDQWQRLGDWVPPERGMDTKNWPSAEANDLFNNCYRIYLWELMEKTALALGRPDDARQCREHIEKIRPMIHREFYNESKGCYVLDEQAYQLMPLMTGVAPPELRATIMKKLEDGILVKSKGHLDTGMLGTYFFLSYLGEIGRDDLIYTLVNQTTYPGWGYMLEQGATTWWEQWNGFYSRIHSCFTMLDGWFYQGLAGIRPDPTAPGFKKIIIRPAIVGDLTWVKCHYDSPYGRIVSNWKRDGNKVTMDVTIPANTTATVFVPGEGPREVNPGTHHFQTRLP